MHNADSVYARFCTKRFPLPTEQELLDLERRVNVRFPDMYREFLLKYNGGFFREPRIMAPVLEPSIHAVRYLAGIHGTTHMSELCSHHSMLIFTENDPPEIVIVGGASGPLIIMVTDPDADDYGNIILKTDRESYHCADDIDEFLGLLHEWK